MKQSIPNWRKPLSAGTRKRIFAALKERGIVDDDARHDVQRGIIGKESLTAFSESDGHKLLEHLERGTGNRKPKTENRPRRKYTRADGIIVMYPKPSVTQKQIRLAYALMRDIIEMEGYLISCGEIDKPKDWTDRPGKRLDGWSKALTNGEAQGISQLMGEEITRLHVQLRNRVTWLHKKAAQIKIGSLNGS